MTLPTECPKCTAPKSLEPIRSDTRGLVWCFCTVCASTVLIDPAVGVIRIHHTQEST